MMKHDDKPGQQPSPAKGFVLELIRVVLPALLALVMQHLSNETTPPEPGRPKPGKGQQGARKRQ